MRVALAAIVALVALNLFLDEGLAKMKQKLRVDDGLKVGDRVRLIPESLTWKAEMTLQGKIGEVIERRDDGRITVRFDNGRLLMDSKEVKRVKARTVGAHEP